LEIFDLDGHNLGTVFQYNPITKAYLKIEWRSLGSKGLTLFKRIRGQIFKRIRGQIFVFD